MCHIVITKTLNPVYTELVSSAFLNQTLEKERLKNDRNIQYNV